MRVRSARDQMSTLQSHSSCCLCGAPEFLWELCSHVHALIVHFLGKNTSAFCTNAILARRLSYSEFGMLLISIVGLP